MPGAAHTEPELLCRHHVTAQLLKQWTCVAGLGLHVLHQAQDVRAMVKHCHSLRHLRL